MPLEYAKSEVTGVAYWETGLRGSRYGSNVGSEIDVSLPKPLPMTIADAGGLIFQSGFNYSISPTYRIRGRDVVPFLPSVLRVVGKVIAIAEVAGDQKGSDDFSKEPPEARLWYVRRYSA